MEEDIKKAIKRMEEVRDKNVHTFVDELTIVLNELDRLQKENEDWSKVYQEEKDKQFDLLTNSIPKQVIKKIRDKAEVMDYYTLTDVVDDLTKVLGK